MWNELNERQRHYLKACYEVDQQNEQSERLAWVRNRRSARPASEWRWMNYHPRGLQDESALQRAIGKAYIDEGAGATFNALEARGLIACRYERAGRVALLYVQMTAQGRKVVRATLPDEQKPQRKPKGALSRSTWRALKLAYDAGEKGLQPERCGISDYGGIDWYPTWGSLYSRGWIEENRQRLNLTASGREIYEARLELHRALYADLYTKGESA